MRFTPASAGAAAPAVSDAVAAPGISYDIVCRDAAGNVKWREVVHNLVTTAGRTDLIDKYLKGSAYTAAWFMGLKGAGTIAAADTLASKAWAEVSAYSGNRPGITWGTTSAGSNTATGVTFTMNASYTVAGAFVCAGATGTSALLYSVSDFGTARSGASGDTLTITPTLSAT